MNELFDIEETPSPRLLWMRRHKVQTHRSPSIPEGGEPWAAWMMDDCDLGSVLPPSEEDCGLSETEDEAIVALAKIKRIPLWDEGGGK